jgi:hypothetical protein
MGVDPDMIPKDLACAPLQQQAIEIDKAKAKEIASRNLPSSGSVARVMLTTTEFLHHSENQGGMRIE